jgi:Domain of unknown function (DUF4186)
VSELRPLAISCKATTCGTNIDASARRHAFSSPLSELPGIGGSCRSCGRSELVDWERLHRRNPTDLPHAVIELRKELIRDSYWSEPLPVRIVRNALRRTPEQLATSAYCTLTSALRVGHPFEGRQTMFAYNKSATIIHCAQHATGTCCRACLEKWLGIPVDQPLERDDIAYAAALVDTYVRDRLERPDHVLEMASR